MTNWPGAIAGASPPSGSSVSVHVSAVSCSRAATRNGRGVIAPTGAGSVAAVAIEVQEPDPGPLEALDHHLGEAPHQLVAEDGIVLALPAQAGAVEPGRADDRERARVEVPAVRREQPRPAEHLARLERLDHDGAAAGNEQLE